MKNDPEQNCSCKEDNDDSRPPHGFGKDVNEYLNNYVRNADTKAGAVIAADLTVGAFLIVNRPPAESCASVLVWVAVLLLVTSAIFGGLVIYPRVPSSGTSLIFWEDILARGGVDAYRGALNDLDSDKREAEYAAQNYHVSQVLHDKYKWIRWCLRFFFVAVTCGAIGIGIG